MGPGQERWPGDKTKDLEKKFDENFRLVAELNAKIKILMQERQRLYSEIVAIDPTFSRRF